MNAAHLRIPPNIQQLLTLARSPGPVRDALMAPRAALDLQGVATLASAQGIDVTVEQLESFSRSLPVPTELSDDALDRVTGGVRGLLGQLLQFLIGGSGDGTGGGGGG